MEGMRLHNGEWKVWDYIMENGRYEITSHRKLRSIILKISNRGVTSHDWSSERSHLSWLILWEEPPVMTDPLRGATCHDWSSERSHLSWLILWEEPPVMTDPLRGATCHDWSSERSHLSWLILWEDINSE